MLATGPGGGMFGNAGVNLILSMKTMTMMMITTTILGGIVLVMVMTITTTTTGLEDTRRKRSVWIKLGGSQLNPSSGLGDSKTRSVCYLPEMVDS